MVSGSDCLQIRGRVGLQLIKGRIQEYVVSCGMITHHFNMFGIVDRMKSRQIQTDLVVNLSNYELTEHEIAVLSKGLKFIPTPTRTNKQSY